MKRYEFLPKEQLAPIRQLPDPFLKPDGTRIACPAEWPEQREYIKQMLAFYLYGPMPPAPGNTKGEVLYRYPVYSGKALSERVRITCGPNDSISFVCQVIRPAVEGKVPVIVWNQMKGRLGSPNEADTVLNHGYAIVEFEREQVADDSPNARCGAVAKAYPEYECGAIAMWAWAQSRVVDYLATTDYADLEKIVATGHSRGGKVAMCCAIYDERIAVCATSGSGCGGAGCLRYLGGRLGEGTGTCETAGSIEDGIAYWWCDEFGKYGLRGQSYTRREMPLETTQAEQMKLIQPELMGKTGDEDYLPFDLHFLRAAMAPRAVISTDGLADTWANPYGTQITWRAADEVFRFLGVPERNALVLRDGGHAYQKLDWQHVVSFCDEMFYGKPMNENIQVRRLNAAPAPHPAVQSWSGECVHFDWRAPQEQ